jgi:hypothetical protein
MLTNAIDALSGLSGVACKEQKKATPEELP